MTSNEKDILLGKISIMMESIADVQLRSVVSLIEQTVKCIDVCDSKYMGFGKKDAADK